MFGRQLLLGIYILSLACEAITSAAKFVLLYCIIICDASLELLYPSGAHVGRSFGVELICHHLLMKYFHLDFPLDIARSLSCRSSGGRPAGQPR